MDNNGHSNHNTQSGQSDWGPGFRNNFSAEASISSSQPNTFLHEMPGRLSTGPTVTADMTSPAARNAPTHILSRFFHMATLGLQLAPSILPNTTLTLRTNALLLSHYVLSGKPISSSETQMSLHMMLNTLWLPIKEVYSLFRTLQYSKNICRM